MSRVRRPRTLRACLGVLAASLAFGAGTVAAAPSASADDSPSLYLVTLRGPGLSGSTALVPRSALRASMLAEQDALLSGLDAEPVYRWTTALNGFAVRLTPAQADRVAASDGVSLVERDSIRPLAAVPARVRDDHGIGVHGPSRGGAGTVIGIVDTGLATDSPLFARTRQSERTDDSFTCDTGPDWQANDCNGKVVGARWFVDGFGADRLRARADLSPVDTDGHGTQMASIAAGNSGVPVRVGGERFGRFAGQAPDAQVAVYKACWSAPDPDDDGCSAADVVTAIDRATDDGVDVLSLSVGGSDLTETGQIDTVERALLGAAEADVVTVAAAGNDGDDETAAHGSPWVTTVGGATGDARAGRVVLRGGPSLSGSMLSRRPVGPVPVVRASRAAAAGSSRAEAAVCTPGSLDAAVVHDALVVCLRGDVGRIDKSRAVALADGAAMVLVNVRPGTVETDVHSVPTVQLTQARGRELLAFLAANPDATGGLAPSGLSVRRPMVAPWSSGGSSLASVLKPDVVGPATSVLGAVPASTGSTWSFATGTSVATAFTSGVASRLVASTDWSASRVRSALATTAAPLRGADLLRSGSGRVRPSRVDAPGLAFDVEPRAYRAWLDGRGDDLNTPSAVLRDGARTVERTITNVGRRRYFSSSTTGFRGDVSVTPAAVRLGRGESATFTVTLERRRGSAVDDGYVVWRGATGTLTRMPVVVAR